MKRLFAGLSAAVLAGAAALTVFADDTVVTPDPGTFEPDPDQAASVLSLECEPQYEIIIPTATVLTENGEGKYAGSGEIVASFVLIEYGNMIEVLIGSGNKFEMANAADETVRLPYTASTEQFGAVDKDAGGKVAEFFNSDEEQSRNVTFTTDTDPGYAGVYVDDTVVYTVRITPDDQ